MIFAAIFIGALAALAAGKEDRLTDQYVGQDHDWSDRMGFIVQWAVFSFMAYGGLLLLVAMMK